MRGATLLDKEKIKKKILEKIEKEHKLGVHGSGSGHLGCRSIHGFEMGEPKEIEREGKKVLEISYQFKIYTETEFEHDEKEQEEFFTERYEAKIMLDQDLNIIS